MDNVHSPAHYNQGGIETIDAIRAALGLIAHTEADDGAH